jgi:uncharacterized protein YlaI
MKCDLCKKDFSFWDELFPNGKYTKNELSDSKIKMYVCKECLNKDGE